MIRSINIQKTVGKNINLENIHVSFFPRPKALLVMGLLELSWTLCAVMLAHQQTIRSMTVTGVT